MPAGIHHITVEKGATFTQTMTWKIDSNVVNLTGYTARLKVRTDGRTRTPAHILISSLTSTSGITLGGAAGTIRLDLSASQTTSLSPGKYSYDLELESAGGVVTRLVQGNFTVEDEVTY
jgi:hypothetical protein